MHQIKDTDCKGQKVWCHKQREQIPWPPSPSLDEGEREEEGSKSEAAATVGGGEAGALGLQRTKQGLMQN